MVRIGSQSKTRRIQDLAHDLVDVPAATIADAVAPTVSPGVRRQRHGRASNSWLLEQRVRESAELRAAVDSSGPIISCWRITVGSGKETTTMMAHGIPFNIYPSTYLSWDAGWETARETARSRNR